jgi:hypothetical protein
MDKILFGVFIVGLILSGVGYGYSHKDPNMIWVTLFEAGIFLIAGTGLVQIIRVIISFIRSF